MERIRKGIILSIILHLITCPLLEEMNQNIEAQEVTAEKEIVLSEKVGRVINKEERNYFGLFPQIDNFYSAIIVQLPDSTYRVYLTVKVNQTLQRSKEIITASTIESYRNQIENFESLSPEEKEKISLPDQAEIIKKTDQAEEQRIRELMKESWSRQRWAEEGKYDGLLDYRNSGTLLGFTLGSAAGMLIGKGLQGKKVERQEHRGGGWDDSPGWTENYYSYEHRYAPYVGGVVGGLVGAGLGYYFGRNADKEYYLRVPQSIRTQRVRYSWASNTIISFVLVGGVMGAISGYALYAPLSGESGSTDFGGGEFLIGYGLYSVMGLAWSSGINGRKLHLKLWGSEKYKQLNPSVGIKLNTMQPTLLQINTSLYGNQEKHCIYGLDLVRIHF